jgi:hypothetical protein
MLRNSKFGIEAEKEIEGINQQNQGKNISRVNKKLFI